MSQTDGKYLVDPDTLMGTLTIRMADSGVSVPAKEVIQRLDGSDGLKPRTGRRIRNIEPQVRAGDVISLRVVLKPGEWTGWEQLDLQDALACA